MMKSPWRTAMAVRQGEDRIFLEDVPVSSWAQKHPALGKPFIRGVVNFVEMLVLGTRLITRSAELAFPEMAAQEEAQRAKKKGLPLAQPAEEAPDDTVEVGRVGNSAVVMAAPLSQVAATPTEEKTQKQKDEESIKAASLLGIVLGVVLAVGLFIVLPSLIIGWLIPNAAAAGLSPVVVNIIEGGVRILIFLAYLIGVSCMKDIRRTFMYHGAEHMTVHCDEQKKPLTVASVRTCSRLHPRCGTSFLLLVMILSILVFSLTGWSGAWYGRILIRLALLPVVASLSYELLRLLAKSDALPVRAIRFPGIQLQRLTTRVPTDDMLEVAIAAFVRAKQKDDDASAQGVGEEETA